MHPAAAFKVEDRAVLLAYLARHPFVTLAAAPDGRLRVAHAPVVVREGGASLDFHLSRNNALTPFLIEGFAGLMTALGPEAYVSPDWYGTADQVPTWNYVSVEIEGYVSVLSDEGLVTLLDDLSAQEEARLAPKPAWTRDKMSSGRFEAMCRGIIGARLTITRLEGTTKLGQNKPPEQQARVIRALGDHPLARLMRAPSIAD